MPERPGIRMVNMAASVNPPAAHPVAHVTAVPRAPRSFRRIEFMWQQTVDPPLHRMVIAPLLLLDEQTVCDQSA